MTWVLYLLSRHPEVEQRSHSEVDQVLGGRMVTIADLPNLPYLKAVMEETLRLYPPTWELFRLVTRDHQFGDYQLRAGQEVLLSPYFVHRHPDFWEDPDRFDPDRFAPERAAQRDRTAFIPFGAGPHLCVGNAFAQTEIQLVLAATAQRYRLVRTTDEPVEPKPLLTTSPGRPVRLRVERR
jgi:cytochrome P450